MHQVLARDEYYCWNNTNLDICFVDSLMNLLDSLQKDCIPDVFFPQVRLLISAPYHMFSQVNLLDRIKNPQVKQDSIRWLKGALARHERTGNVMEIFK